MAQDLRLRTEKVCTAEEHIQVRQDEKNNILMLLDDLRGEEKGPNLPNLSEFAVCCEECRS